MHSIAADTGREPVPGSMGEQIRRHKELLGKDAYLLELRQRLTELVEMGLEEAFLIKSVRDEVGRHVAALADSGAASTARARRRAEIEESAENPDFIREFRERLTASDSHYQDLSDEEIRERLLKMMDIVQPRSIEDETAVWSLNDGWVQRSQEQLSDELIDDWRSSRALRSS